MRALLNPEIAHRMGVVLFRPGAEIMHMFMQGRMLLEPQPESMANYATGLVPVTVQPLAEDPSMISVFEHPQVIQRAGGLPSLDAWLEDQFICQYPHSTWHAENYTNMRHEPGTIRLCWHCDNQLRGQHTERLAAIARENLITWLIESVRRQLGFNDAHALTLPEFCWWMVRSGLGDIIPEGVARKALRLPEEKIESVMREVDLRPSYSATEILQEEAKKVITLKIDPETPESFMLRPKRRRWENEKYTRWVKAQPCICCNQPADDPHHLIGHGMGGMATKAHDLFVIPLCRAHHDELHANAVAFEEKYGTQPELLLKTLDRALAIGVLA